VIIAIVLGVVVYKKRKNKKLAEELARRDSTAEADHTPLVQNE
jgi:hypothetical protein